jgi:hypothetical protein
MADNLESHIANLNDVSGAVQILNTDVHILQTEINQIEGQISQLLNMIQLLNANLQTMQLTMLAGAVFSFGAGALSTIGDAGIDLAEEGSMITFGAGDGVLSMDADGIELEDLSLSENSLSIGESGTPGYTKIGQGTIQSGQFSVTMTADDTAYVDGIGEVWIDNGFDGESVEINNEGFKINPQSETDL